jgi:hypothetical protein
MKMGQPHMLLQAILTGTSAFFEPLLNYLAYGGNQWKNH